jgi:cell division protein FtsB
MADLRALIEFIVAIVSAYFLIKIENVKQQKDITTLQSRVDKLEQKQNEEIREMHGFIREIRDMIQELEIKILQKDRRTEH